MKLFIALILFCKAATALNSGIFDTSFSNDGVTDGWDYQSSAGVYVYGQDLLVDSQNRILTTSRSSGVVTVLRYLPNGELDSDFNSGGKIQLPTIIDGSFTIKLAMGKSDDFYIAYTFQFCGSECDNDMVIYNIDSTGTILSTKNIAIDIGGTAKNDLLEDILYISSLDKIIVLSTSFVSVPQNNDFGLAVFDVNTTTAELTYDVGFSSDGKASCAFNHQDVNGSHDKAESLVWSENNQTFIAGGSAFEGNGVSNNGWNLGFCEFNLQGSLLRKWSTKGLLENIYNLEQLKDIEIHTSGFTQSLIVAAKQVNTEGDNKMAVTSYYWDFLQSDWILDTGFGGNGNGWNAINFDVFFNGNKSSDSVASMSMEASGKIILAGTSHVMGNQSYMALAKFNLDGSLDSNWGNVNYSGKEIAFFPDRAFEDDVSHIALNPRTEEIFISGTSEISNESNSYIAKLFKDGIFRNGFD